MRELSSIGFDFFWYFVFDHDTVFLDGDFGFLFVDFDSYQIRILDFGLVLGFEVGIDMSLYLAVSS